MCKLSIIDLKTKIKNLKLFSYKNTTSSTIITQNIKTNNILMNIDNILDKDLSGETPIDSFKRNNRKAIIEKACCIENSSKILQKKLPIKWLATFYDHCKNVSDENLQNIWASILQDEMKGENSTSIRAMHILSSISSQEAKLFERAMKYRINNWIYYKESKMPPSFPTFDDFSLLLEIGLVKQMQHVVQKYIPPIENTRLNKNTRYLLGTHYNMALVCEASTPIDIPSVILSKAGAELSKFISYPPELEYLSYLSKFLKQKKGQLKQATVDSSSGQIISPLVDVD